MQQPLFSLEEEPHLPAGMVYQPEFLSPPEEEQLVAMVQTLPFQEARYKQWTAKRRVVSFGGRYDFSSNRLLTAPPVPQCLHPLRQRIAGWCGLPAAAFTHALIAEYSAGTELGWHRDVPEFESIVGVSLAASARLRLRPYPPGPEPARATRILTVAPRSIYLLSGAARWNWQHAVSPTKALRYSMTFRTLAS